MTPGWVLITSAAASAFSGAVRAATSIERYPSLRVSKMAEIWRMMRSPRSLVTRSSTSSSPIPSVSPSAA